MSGFTDLRLHQVGGRQDESFWPSFTDIMMVVVMIFLITSATLILRNTELIRQLTESEESKKIAAEVAEDSQAENVTLEQRLRAVQHKLAMSRLQQLQTMEEKFDLKKQLGITQEQLIELEHQRGELSGELGTTKLQNNAFDKAIAELRQQLSQSKQQQRITDDKLVSTIAQLRATTQILNEQQQRRNISRDELTRTIAQLAESHAQVQFLQTEKLAQSENVQLSDEKLAELHINYVDLKSKYDKLVRPARIAKGKYVVSVRYTHAEDGRAIMLKKPEDGQFYSIDNAAMHAELSALKARFADKLYIRIIIPDDSNLSYNEAWTFTHDLLNRYDYYHQGNYQTAPSLE